MKKNLLILSQRAVLEAFLIEAQKNFELFFDFLAQRAFAVAYRVQEQIKVMLKSLSDSARLLSSTQQDAMRMNTQKPPP